MNIYPRSTSFSRALFALALSILVVGTSDWWAQVDSNHRPRAYQARALTTWAMSPCKFRCISSLEPFLNPHSRVLCSHSVCRSWVAELPPGGDDGNRTHDPLLAGQVLSQLSYTPILGLFTWVNSHSKLNNNESRTRLRLCSLAVFFGFGLFPNYKTSTTRLLRLTFSIERRWSSRTFRYGYLVTT